MNKLAAIAVLALFAVPACANEYIAQYDSDLSGEYLAPDDSDISGRKAALPVVFRQAFDPVVRVRATVEPSFSPEFAVGVREDKGIFRIFRLALAIGFWHDRHLRTINWVKDGGTFSASDITRLKNLQVKECSFVVDPALGARIVAAWKSALSRVVPHRLASAPHEEILLDGDKYHFSMNVGGRELSAGITSPPATSEAGQMTGLVNAMAYACDTKDPGAIAKINQLAGEVLAQKAR